MTADNQISSCIICGGIEAVLSDLTSHYFGGYYHVRIQISAELPVLSSVFEARADYDDAVKRLGQSVRFSRILEKMAVPENLIGQVRNSLIDSFNANMLPYLKREDFIGNYIRNEYRTSLRLHASRFR
jgi:hypothetical protein